MCGAILPGVTARLPLAAAIERVRPFSISEVRAVSDAPGLIATGAVIASEHARS